MSTGGAQAHDDFDGLPPGDDLEGELPPEELTVEQRARIRGWLPLDEYTGPPGRWRDAAEYMRISDEDIRVTREENRRLEKKVHRLQNQVGDLVKSAGEQLEALREMRQIAAKNDQRGYDRAMRELTEQRAAAVDAGDRSAFEQVEEQIKVLGPRPTDPPPAPPPPTPPAGEVEIDPAITEFIEDNRDWYTKDDTLTRTMISNYDIVARRNPRWAIPDVLTEAKRRTVAEYPESFPDMAHEAAPAPPARRAATGVARPSAGPSSRPQRQQNGWDQIADPQERAQVRGAYERQKRADPGLTEAEFLTIYLDPHTDVLQLRAQRARP